MMKKKRSSFINGGGRMRLINEETFENEEAKVIEWETRPGGMLVQKRCSKSDSSSSPPPNLRVRIAYGSLRYEISINPQSTFGEMKKLISTETGLQPGEQTLTFRGKERANGEYLIACGFKDRSKVILMEDPSSKEKRYIEMRKNAKIQNVQRAISDISMEVDKLVQQVSTIEKSISNGNKVAEVQITILIEMLMRQAIKLDSISTEGVASAQKKLQSKRVQNSVETLDMLKVENIRPSPMDPLDITIGDGLRVKSATATTNRESLEVVPPTAPTATSNWEFFD